MADGHRSRVKKKVSNFDIDVLEDHELLEFLLYPFIPRKDIGGLARQLLSRYGTLKKVLQADSSDLFSFPNMTENAALYLPLILKVAARADSSEVMKRGGTSSPKTVAEFITYKLSHEKFEKVYAISLDGHNRISSMREIAAGDDTQVEIDSIDIVQFSIAERARKLVIAHNHPVDTPYPSQADINATKNLKETLKQLNISLEDHVIVSGKDYFSFRINELMEDKKLDGLTSAKVKDSCRLRSVSDFGEEDLWQE